MPSADPQLWLPYTQMQGAPESLAVASAEGARLNLADGRCLIDGIASWWTACHGYGHPHIRNQTAAQLERLPHVMLGGLTNEPALTLAHRLKQILPGDLNHTFFSESGSVSVEVAMKMALQCSINRGETSKRRFVSFLNGYHGDTTGAMSVCDPDEGMHRLFRGLVPQQHVVALPASDAEFAEFATFMEQHKQEIAGLIMEPLAQCAGGMKFHSPEQLSRIATVCEETGVLFILDEIATGFGRTGTLFACEQAGCVPDIITLSKALTGGTMPLAATIARTHVFESFLGDDPELALMHGPTFSANALGAAAANASLDLFEREPRLSQVAEISEQLKAELAPASELPGVADVRVLGAIGVVELEGAPDLVGLRAEFVRRGVWVRPFGNVVYLMPPFVIERTELQQLTSAIVDVIRSRPELLG